MKPESIPHHLPDAHAIKRRAPLEGATPRPPDLFDTLDRWLDSPVLAYSSWISRHRLKESTKKVYIAMFSRFCQWLEGQGRRLDHLEVSDIARFLDAPNPNVPVSRQHAQRGRQRQQYVRQLERIFSHLGALGQGGKNPGSEAGRHAIGHGIDKPTRFLSPEESKSVMVRLQKRLAELRREQKGVDEWMEYRDLALVGVMIGGGLKVQHAMTLTLNCIDTREDRIDLSETGHAHRARVLAFARAPIEAWLQVQASLHGGRLAPAQKVFEAGRKSGFGRNSKVVTLSASSIHRRVQAFLKAAGIDGERASAQTLRNTYAGLLIEGGATNEHLVDYLGLRATETAIRLRSAYAASRKAIDETIFEEKAA